MAYLLDNGPHRYTVVTHEKPSMSLKRIKIPEVLEGRGWRMEDGVRIGLFLKIRQIERYYYAVAD